MDNVNGINIGGFQNVSNNIYTNTQKNNTNLSKINHTSISNQSPTLNKSQTEIEVIDFDDISNIEEKKQNNEFLEGLKKTGATAVVGTTSAISGILKLGENIQDGVTWIEGTVTSGILDLFGADELAEDIRKKTQEEIAKDKVGKLNELFYTKTEIGRSINETSLLKYDSETAQAIQNISTEATKFIAATALTVGTAGLAAPVSAALVFGTGAVQGIGASAEKRYQDPNNNDYATGAILLDGLGSGFSWYASGKLGQGAVGLTKVVSQSISQTGVKGTTTLFKNIIKQKAKEFNLKNLLTKDFYKNTLKNGLFDFDQLIDSASMGVDNITSAISNGTEIDWKKFTKEVIGSYALNCTFEGFTNLFSKNININKFLYDQELLTESEEALSILSEIHKQEKINQNSVATKLINDYNIKKTSLSNKVAYYFNDPKQFVISKLSNIYYSTLDKTILPDEFIQFINYVENTRVVDIDDDYIKQISKCLNEEDLKKLEEISNNSILNTYSETEKKLIKTYTAYSGPAITAYLRNTNCDFGGSTFYGTSKKYVEDYLARSMYAANESVLLKKYGDADEFVKAMDKIVKKSSPLKENLTVYRSCDNLFMDGNKILTFDKGTRFNDSAFISTSIVPTNISTKSNVIMELEIPKGTKAAYLEPVAGSITYNQQELLLGRNSEFEIIEYNYNEQTGQVFVKAKLVDSNMPKTTNSTIVNDLSNITTELNITEKIIN